MDMFTAVLARMYCVLLRVITILISFSPLDAMHKCGQCRQAIAACWVSVTFVYCVETAKDLAVVAVECE